MQHSAIGLIAFALFLAFQAPVAGADETPPADVRVLIDVSGSMKQNDPHNLRIPALKLLVNLMPPGAWAGVWLFAEQAQPLVPLERVDQNWQKQALALAAKIHSRGQRTDIESALKKAALERQTADAISRRRLILLTDGLVDVGKEADKNAASKKRILQELLPSLQQQKVRIYTIALSANADHSLLEKIAHATGGWHEAAHTAEQLQRAFLKMFNKAVPRATLPLNDNRFKVDGSIREFTLLAFHPANAPPTRLISPAETTLAQSQLPPNVRWHHEAAYDLITVEQPASGEWRLIAQADPDNQVMIVTDLQLRVNELPSYIHPQEPIEFSAYLTEKGARIERDEFLQFARFTLRQEDEQGHRKDWPILPDEAQKGVFVQTLQGGLKPGLHTFTVTVEGKTFQRAAARSIRVLPLLTAEENAAPAAEKPRAPNDQTEEGQPKTAQAASPSSWPMTLTILGLVNIFMIGLGFWAYRLLRKRSAEKRAQLLDRLSP